MKTDIFNYVRDYDFIILNIILSIIIYSVLVYISFNSNFNFLKVKTNLFAFFLITISILISPFFINLFSITKITFVNIKEDIFTDMEKFGDGSFDHYYEDPVVHEDKESRNFIFIYLESLEHTFFSEEHYPDLLPNIKEIESKSTSFTNITPMEGTRSTITGMVASLCSIPLTAPGIGYAYSADKFKAFLPNIDCSTDILNKIGYKLTYIGGARSEFANKKLFLENHGFEDIIGKKEILEKINNEDYETSNWGVYDDEMLKVLYDKYLNLLKKEDKFGLFSLTLDTHVPKGFPSPSCDNHKYKHGKNPVLNSVHCTDKLIGEFFEKIYQLEKSKDTVIVFATDHISQNGKQFKKKGISDRKLAFFIFDPKDPKGRVIDTEGSVLDISATTLPFLNIKADMGFSRNLLDEKESSESLEIRKKIGPWRDYFIYFWNIRNEIKDNITISKDLDYIKVDNQVFYSPLMASIDENNKFQIRLSGYRNKTNFEKYFHSNRFNSFIIIDKCKKILEESDYNYNNNEEEDQLCYKTSFNEEIISSDEINQKIIIPKENFNK